MHLIDREPECLRKMRQQCRAQHQGDQMGLRVVPLSQLSFRIRPGGVEVAKADAAQAMGPAIIVQ